MQGTEVSLSRDCAATIVPNGDQVMLEQGTPVLITQALGGTVTVRTDLGLFRIDGADVDALGQTPPTEEPAEQFEGEFSEDHLWQALKSCYDPEIPINIVDLGLIYDLAHQPSEKDASLHTVSVKMTLTAQGCGMGPSIAADAKAKIEAHPAVESATVDIVWDPVWNPQMISEDGRKTLGLN